ncbi:MAG: hypothetical protein IT168_32220 [Bryobacterales bacterium]|nr:hypothetical protein [Bryobacterales bacterium]
MAVEEQMPETQAAPVAAPPLVKPATGFRKWLAIGTGVGIEIDGADLRILIARVRPGGVTVLATHRIERFIERPASEWGTDLLAFLRKYRVARTPVSVLLPRQEVIVRQLAMPGVDKKDLEAAVTFQIDSLHPYPEDTVAFTWAQLPAGTTVLVGIARREYVENLANLFTEAGLLIAGFTFSAAALYSAARILVAPPPAFVAAGPVADQLEIYGESPTRPVFSGVFETSNWDRAHRFARSELRIEEGEAVRLADLMAAPRSAPAHFNLEVNAQCLAAAIAGACPRLALPANLLPVDRRSQTSRLIYIPTLILTVLLLVITIVLWLQPSHEDKKYLAQLNSEVRTLERQAVKASQLDRDAQKALAKIAVLDRHRRRSQADADALRELTNVLQPPVWLNLLQITRIDAIMNGEAEQAAPLLKVIDESPIFKDSAFSQSMTRIGGATAESFIIRTQREGPGTGLEQGEQR